MARNRRKSKGERQPPLPIPHEQGESHGHYTRWTYPPARQTPPRPATDIEQKEEEHEQE